MSNRAARKTSYEQPELFPPDQGDLFGGEAAPRRDVYIPNPESVRSTCALHLAKLHAMTAWTDESHPGARARLLKRAAYLYGVTADDTEAEEWRVKFEAAFARLDAIGPRKPPGEREHWWHYDDIVFEPEWVRRPPGR